VPLKLPGEMLRKRATEQLETDAVKLVVSCLKKQGLLRNRLQKGMDERDLLHFMGLFGPKFYPIDKANIFADYLENQLILHDLRDYAHK
jgi:hypothetical protein